LAATTARGPTHNPTEYQQPCMLLRCSNNNVIYRWNSMFLIGYSKGNNN